MSVDQLDLRIIRSLDGDGRKPFRQIAEELVISENTARNHVSRILDKLDLTRRSEAAAFAAQHGLLDGADPDRDTTR